MTSVSGEAGRAPHDGRRLSTGLRYVVAAAVFFSLMSLHVKLAGARLHSTEIVFARGLLGLAFTYLMLTGAVLVVAGAVLVNWQRAQVDPVRATG